MKIINILFISILCWIIAGCASGKSSAGAPAENKLEALTDFSVALNSNDFTKALSLLVEKEKLELLAGRSTIGPKARMQLKALRLQVLIKNKNIKLSGGKLEGIVGALPHLEHISEEALQNPTRVQPAVPLDSIVEETPIADTPTGEAPKASLPGESASPEPGAPADSGLDLSVTQPPTDSAKVADTKPAKKVETPKAAKETPSKESDNVPGDSLDLQE